MVLQLLLPLLVPRNPTHTLSISDSHSLHESPQCRPRSSGSTAGESTNGLKKKEGREGEEQWEETLREQRSMEGKFGGDLRLGPSPGFLFLSLSLDKREVQGPLCDPFSQDPFFLTQTESKEGGF